MALKENIIKTSKLLYQYGGKEESRLSGVVAGVKGAAGIQSSARPEGVNAQAKYSTLVYILDKIFVDKKVVAYACSENIYIQFEDSEKTYHCICDGSEASWVDSSPNDYNNLIPFLVYALSDLNTEEGSAELRSSFNSIKNDENIVEAELLFCDSFYYGFTINENHENLSIVQGNLSLANIKSAINLGVYEPIDIFEGLMDTKELKLDTAEEPIAVDVKKNNNYEVQYNLWNDEAKTKIPSLDTLKTYVETDITHSIARKIKYRSDIIIKRLDEGISGIEAIGGDYSNILLDGRPGTGKTQMVYAIGAMTGMPVYTIPFSKNTEEDTMEGKNKVVNGKVDFVETEFLKVYEQGGIALLEEINLADPAVVMGSLGQAIEYPFIVMKDGYKPVRRHPLCVIIGTMNTGTAGSKKLNQALSSRFKATYILDDPSERTFVKILESKGFEKAKCKYVYDAYKDIMTYLQDPSRNQLELCENITLRGCFGALECWEEGDDPKEAIKNSMIGKIAEVNLEAAREVERQVLDSFREFGAATSRRRPSRRR